MALANGIGVARALSPIAGVGHAHAYDDNRNGCEEHQENEADGGDGLDHACVAKLS